jgi:CDP-6-deoxy-D-xylo-4-hexulose-3-dehydrase
MLPEEATKFIYYLSIDSYVFESLQQNVDYRIIGKLSNTDLILNKGFFIGCYPGITISDIYYIVDIFKQYFKNYKG